jgi:signal peptidase I
VKSPTILLYYGLIVLVGAVLLLTGSVFIVQSGSMSPAVDAGDVIVCRSPNSLLNPGDIVTYQHEDKLITHRIVEILPDGLRTQGDANEEPDPWIVPQGAVRRVAWFRIRYLGFFLAYLKTKQGWFLGIIVPAILIILNETAVILRELLRPPQREVSA